MSTPEYEDFDLFGDDKLEYSDYDFGNEDYDSYAYDNYHIAYPNEYNNSKIMLHHLIKHPNIVNSADSKQIIIMLKEIYLNWGLISPHPYDVSWLLRHKQNLYYAETTIEGKITKDKIKQVANRILDNFEQRNLTQTKVNALLVATQSTLDGTTMDLEDAYEITAELVGSVDFSEDYDVFYAYTQLPNTMKKTSKIKCFIGFRTENWS